MPEVAPQISSQPGLLEYPQHGNWNDFLTAGCRHLENSHETLVYQMFMTQLSEIGPSGVRAPVFPNSSGDQLQGCSLCKFDVDFQFSAYINYSPHGAGLKFSTYV